jgi:hypothetical protein
VLACLQDRPLIVSLKGRGSLRARDPRNNKALSRPQTQLPGLYRCPRCRLAGLVPTLTGDQITRLRIVRLANNEIVMNEMARLVSHAPDSPAKGKEH